MPVSVLNLRRVELKNKIDGPCACTVVPIKKISFFTNTPTKNTKIPIKIDINSC